MKTPKTYYGSRSILRALNRLPTATRPGKSADGAMVRLFYTKRGPVSRHDKREALWARTHGVPLDMFTGKLDRIWTDKKGNTIVTMLVMERRNEDGFCYRSFNFKKGNPRQMEVVYPKRMK